MRILIAMALVATLAACTTKPNNDSDPAVIAAKAYRHPGPPTLTLITVVNNRNGSGAHTGLMISGSQRVIWDPAGSFKNIVVPEHQDVLYGVTPAVFAGYKSAHARSTYRVVTQQMQVSAATAEQALALVQKHGAVGDAGCTSSTSAILAALPEFDGIKTTWFPGKLMKQIAERPGVVTDVYYEDDEGTIQDGIAALNLSE